MLLDVNSTRSNYVYYQRRLEQRAQSLLGNAIETLNAEFQLSGTREALEVFSKLVKDMDVTTNWKQTSVY